jgi:hypothetical protein
MLKNYRLILCWLFFFTLVRGSDASPTWVYFSGDEPSSCSGNCVTTYIDPSSKTNYGFGTAGIKTLTDFSETAQSATTFGLSSETTVIFDCLKSKYRANEEVWHSLKQGAGKITKRFPADKKWSPIPVFNISLFSKLCSP